MDRGRFRHLLRRLPHQSKVSLVFARDGDLAAGVDLARAFVEVGLIGMEHEIPVTMQRAPLAGFEADRCLDFDASLQME